MTCRRTRASNPQSVRRRQRRLQHCLGPHTQRLPEHTSPRSHFLTTPATIRLSGAPIVPELTHNLPGSIVVGASSFPHETASVRPGVCMRGSK